MICSTDYTVATIRLFVTPFTTFSLSPNIMELGVAGEIAMISFVLIDKTAMTLAMERERRVFSRSFAWHWFIAM